MKALFLILKDEEANKFLPWYSMKSIVETREFYEKRYVSKYMQPRGYAYAICLKENNFPIGYVNIDLEEPYDFGYGLRKEFWHKGIATDTTNPINPLFKYLCYLFLSFHILPWMLLEYVIFYFH